MRTKIVFVITLAVALQASAITIGQVQTVLDSWIDAREVAITNAINTCLANQEACYTGWSCASDIPCNTVTADSSACTNTLTDPGISDACGVPTGVATFASRGFTLPATAPICFKVNTYTRNGPSARGAQVCYRGRFNGVTYERCRGYGPQTSAFNSPWHVVQ